MKSTMNFKRIWEAYHFPMILLSSIVIGSILGVYMGSNAMIFKPLGDIFINGMFTIVVPLVFVTISSSISSMNNLKKLGHILRSLFIVFISTGLVAAVLILIVVSIFPPALGVQLETSSIELQKPFETGSQIVNTFTVNDFPLLLSKSHLLPLIIFALLFGLSINLAGDKGKPIAKALDSLSEVFLKMIGLLMYYAPIGLGAYFAALIGQYGQDLIGSYTRAMLIYYPLCIAYFIFAFPIYAFIAGGKEGVRRLQYIISPAITALATQSSIATIPVNLEACEKIGVPKEIRDIVLPIGATAHMDGTVIGTILKISFLFGIYGIPFTGVETFTTALLLSLAGGIVMSGIPGGGLIGEIFIVSMYGFPPEAFPIIATLGYLIDPPATMINATGDTIASMLVTRMVEGKDWIANKLT